MVRTWLMRGTLHVIATQDLGMLLGLLGPVFAAGNQARHAQLGLDKDLKRRGVTAIQGILSRAGPLTRNEIVDRLQRRGIKLDRKTQAPIHLIQVAALEGVLCLGPDRENGEPTYVLIDDWGGAAAILVEPGGPRRAGSPLRRGLWPCGARGPGRLVRSSGCPGAIRHRHCLAGAGVGEGRRPLMLDLERTDRKRSRAPAGEEDGSALARLRYLPARLSKPRVGCPGSSRAPAATWRRLATPCRGGRRARSWRLEPPKGKRPNSAGHRDGRTNQ